jgi:hypothetical protein
MRFKYALCALALAAPASGFSQVVPAESVAVVDAGSRVRIAAPVFGNKKQVGTVVSVTRDTLILRQGAATATRSLATSDITGLEIARGTHTRKAKGALWGLLIGAGSGAAIGYLSYKEKKCNDPQTIFGCNFDILGPDSKGSNAVIGAITGAIFGPIAGALWGMRRTDTWVPATVSTK